jgi:putative ABC transport system permease protein
LVVYVYRSLVARLRANVVTVLSILLFVTGSSIGLTTYLSLERELVSTTPSENILVIASGAPNVNSSRLDRDTAGRLAVLDGVSKIALESISEVHDFTEFERATPIRGIDDTSAEIHRATLESGAWPARQTLEVAVGRRVLAKYPDLKPGKDLHLPAGVARITGVFATGGPMDDELWTPRAALDLHAGAPMVCSATLVAESRDQVAAIVDKVNNSKDLEATAMQLAEYQARRAGLGTILRICLALLVLLLVVATVAISVTMTAAIRARIPELATLVAIGIRRGFVARMVLLESVALAALGALLGVGASELVRRLLGSLQVGPVVELAWLPIVPIAGFGLGVLVGLFGGLTPAIAVRRLDVIKSIR